MPTPKAGYFLDSGDQVPGCTTVLGVISTTPGDALIQWGVNLFKEGKNFRDERQRLGDVGTAIHDECEHVDRPAVRPLWANDAEWNRIRKAKTEWALWLEQYAPEIVAQEKQLVSKVYRTGGTFDNVLRWQGKIYVGDYKSGRQIDRAKVAAQLAFYSAAVTECMGLDVGGALVFHMPAKGNMRVIEMDMNELGKGLDLFKAARAAYDAIAAFRRN